MLPAHSGWTGASLRGAHSNLTMAFNGLPAASPATGQPLGRAPSGALANLPRSSHSAIAS